MKNLVSLTLLSVLFFTAHIGNAQKFSKLDKSPLDVVLYPSIFSKSDVKVKVTYSRPQKKGREIFGDLVKYDKVWRTGANESVEITFYSDANFGGKQVPAGTYSLFTIPGKNQWTIIINKVINKWGAYSYDKNEDVVRVTAAATTAKDALEAFGITFHEKGDTVQMVLGWDTTRVGVPIQF